ncbi:hypothetical protein LMG28688_01635 [Paraburkholderia caffeinitolerans]|uniref:Uncharacterized protein n=1 Tax=Paraburkholderia caffeinitolerans TaxID=1723730 RepID=A0A6J5FRG0_9BURK|nr:hypothetical protein [Paraburkholderia caffeinitolerans]CAB3783379.1 hypothetical protein LMG28688_01635 [Paraburkholderia caffeinitolerans]
MNAWIKLLAATGLFVLWGALVFTHQADPKELVMGIAAALTGLGVFHAATNGASPDGESAASIGELGGSSTPAEPALGAGGYQPKSAVMSPPPVPAPAPTAAAPAAVQ